MLEVKMKERDGLYGCRLRQKQNTRHDGSYRCRLCSKTKRKNVTDRMGADYVKTKQET